MSNDLNPIQQKAVTHIHGPALVIAGAGSGKTRIITFRIAYLIQLGVPAGEILAVTFTNKAAQEMRERVQRKAHCFVLTCTFHSLGAKILRESIHYLGYQKNFTIYDEDDCEKLIKESAVSLNLKTDKNFLKSVRSSISQMKNTIPSSVAIKDQSIRSLFEVYQSKLKEYQAVDFDDLLYLPLQLFENHPDVIEFYQKKWSFILIDEYQDTNSVQHRFIQMLTAHHKNVFAVGDPDQSIYSWRGAKVNNILNFETDFPGATIITLDQNYRSQSNILNTANSLIQHNPNRYEKNLWSDLGSGEKVSFYLADNDHEEAEFVIKKLLKYQESYSLNDCVIFYRTNFQSRIFEDTLLKFRIPYAIIGGLSFYQRREIKDILALLRVVIGGFDFIAFSRTINLSKRGLGETALKKLKEGAENNRLSIFNYCLSIVDRKIDHKLSSKQFEGLKDYTDMILALREMVQYRISLQMIVSEAIERSRYFDYLQEDQDTYPERKENLNELIAKTTEWEKENPGGTLSDFLEELTLKTNPEDHNGINDTVKLMTLHNGKGLEFSVVFLVGMEEDLFPHLNAKDNEEAIEEERRLCYVGMTRAKKYLYLTAARFRFLWGEGRLMRLSRFIQEISPFLNFLRGAPISLQASDDEEIFSYGQTVYHKDFGTGVIKKSYETSMGLTYDIYFPESGLLRSFVAKYAKLIKSF